MSLIRTLLISLIAFVATPALPAFANNGLADSAALFARELVALRNERTSIALRAEAFLRGTQQNDEAEAILRITRFSAQRQAVIDMGAANIARARRLPIPALGSAEDLAFAEALDPFLVDAVQFLEPRLADRMLQIAQIDDRQQSFVIFDWLFSTLGTGGSYTIPVGGALVAQAINDDPLLREALAELSTIARELFDARANAPIALKVLPDRIPPQWQRFVGAGASSGDDSAINTIGAMELSALRKRLAALEQSLDSWLPTGCLAEGKSTTQLAIISMIRTLEVAAPSLERLHSQLLRIDENVPSLVLLERFNTVDTLQISLDSQWLESGAALADAIRRGCREG